MKSHLHYLTAIIFLTLLSFNNQATAEENKADLNTNKVYIIYLKHGEESSGGGITINNAKIQQFLGEEYIVGDALNEYLRNTIIRIPKNNIGMIMEYKTIKDWKKSIENYYKETSQPEPNNP